MGYEVVSPARSADRPADKDKAQPPRPPRSGRSGKGADSALKQLREWEQRRARDRAAPVRDKPSPA